MYDKIKANKVIFIFLQDIQYLNLDRRHWTFFKIQMTHTICIKIERRMGDSRWRLWIDVLPAYFKNISHIVGNVWSNKSSNKKSYRCLAEPI